MSDGETALDNSMPLGRHAEIEQAKGVLMVLHGTTAEQAFELLAEVSQRRNVTVHRIATAVMDAVRAGFSAGDVESARASLDLVVDRLVDGDGPGGGSVARPEETDAVRHRR